ncbi:FYN-binding protein 1 isoform X2 [Eleginops maclovinus]|uniref:FYN-binding protein 1 isoform X2 n=1 Tax=Eleginops maclovinus TaxID=56733 RepID=UPI0030809C96
MDQEDTLDFKALMAKFQEEQLLLKQPKSKPALPEKPKSVPPPTSPSYFLPAGARPSLLTSINHTLDGKTVNAPNVIFKEDKKQSKKPLISKVKDKSEEKLKKGKDKTLKGSKEKLEEISDDQKQKKEKKFPLFPGASRGKTAELVPATPPPKSTLSKNKGILGFKKSIQRNSAEVPADLILDSPSLDITGQAPLIPLNSDYGVVPPEISAQRALLPNIPSLPDSTAVMEITPPSTIPASPELTPPPTFVPDIQALQVPSLEIETPLEMETPAVHISRPASQNGIIPNPSSDSPTPPPSLVISSPSPVTSTPPPSPPEPEIVAEACVEAVNIAAVETPPPPPATDPPSIPSSPKSERPISALSALSRAEDMVPARKMSPVDQRIFNALEKARKKISQPTNPTTSYSTPPPSEELPPSPTISLPDLPPIDYEGKANSLDHRQASPVLEGITEEGSDPIPELLVVPPPPPKRPLPDVESLGVSPEKPHRPPSVNLIQSIPPPPLEEIPAPADFSEADPTDIPEFDDVTSDAYSTELQVSEWGNGEFSGQETPEQQNLPEFYSNGTTPPEAEVQASPTPGEDYPDNRLSGISFPVLQESPGISAETGNDVHENTENVYEDITTSSSKKKSKSESGKKRKGPPKNPYAEAQQETIVEKSKTGRFGKSEKKAAAEGPDEKELKKKEKQRLEKEKKELKEKQEREKKEQKEREKKENEMKKKFKITGQEEAMYEAKVTVATKGRKNYLTANSGDIISIIRTTNCPKGKWLARDSSNNYGYVAVDHVELDIKEMLELGKKAAISRRSNNNNNVVEEELTGTGSRATNHYPLSAESFEDDSEEWTGDEEEPISPAPETADPLTPMGHNRTLSMPDMGNRDLSVNHQHSQSDISAEGTHDKARHEALQKLATFFHSPKPAEPVPSIESVTSPVIVEEEEEPLPEITSLDFDHPDWIILPPPDMYADLTVE